MYLFVLIINLLRVISQEGGSPNDYIIYKRKASRVKMVFHVVVQFPFIITCFLMDFSKRPEKK